MALTLDKAKAKEIRKNSQSSNKSGEVENTKSFEIDYLPTEKELKEIKDKYRTFMKLSGDINNVGTEMEFRVLEQ